MFNFTVSTFFMTGVSKCPDEVFLRPSVKQLCLLFQKLCGTNYPTSICFIVVNEFCERFSYYGMKGMRALCLDDVWSRSTCRTALAVYSAVLL